MSNILKKIDEFGNTHYLNVVNIDNEKLNSLTVLYDENQLKSEHLNDLLFLAENKYIDAKTEYIKSDNDLKNLYEIDILGEGGQGVVYKTKNADTVIKIALKNELPIKNKEDIEAFRQKIKNLIHKPLPNDMNIAKPLSLLKDEAGYVMNLLDGMYPFAELLPQELSKEKANTLKIPTFLQTLEENDKRSAIYFTHYLQTGGLRKRLYALSRLAIVLYRLHSRGVVYFDISHNNIFINNDDIPLVYLIDADNIEYESTNRDIIYTPGFEVPEFIKEEPNTTYSDIYAFGILGFLTLTMKDPFSGKAYEEDLEDGKSIKKDNFELPWIGSSSDPSNQANQILNNFSSKNKQNYILTKELYNLFNNLFENGTNNKYKRPTLPIWIESLEKAASWTLLCPSCEMSYYEDLDNCPYCDKEKPKRLVVNSYYYKDDEKQQIRWQYIKEISENTKKIELPSYIFKTLDVLKIDDIFLEIKFPNKSRIELSFDKTDEDIFFESKTPIRVLTKRVGLEKFEKGVSMIIKSSNITTLVEIKIEQ